MNRDNYVKKITEHPKRIDVFRLDNSDYIEEDSDTDHKTITSIPLVSLASKHCAPIDGVTDLMTAEEREKQQVIEFVKQRLVDDAVKFHNLLNHSKTFASLYKTTVCNKLNMQKILNDDSKLQRFIFFRQFQDSGVELFLELNHQI